MGDFLQVCPKRLCISTVGKRTDLFARDPFKVPITDFFGSVRNVELTTNVINLTENIVSAQTEVPSMKNEEKHIYEYKDPLPILTQFEKYQQ